MIFIFMIFKYFTLEYTALVDINKTGLYIIYKQNKRAN